MATREPKSVHSISTLREAGPHLVLLASVALLMMFVRLIFAPLLVEMQASLAIGPARAARFFLAISIGYTASMLMSGFVASRVRHRGAIITGGVIWSMGLLIVGVSSSLLVITAGFFILGAGAGFYPPSGVAAVSDLASEQIRSRAISLHEAGPTSAFVLAPLFVSAILTFGSWRTVVLAASAISVVVTVSFAAWGRSGCLRGSSPRLSNLRAIMKLGRFWALLLFFLMAASSTMGVYAILPTFLVQTRGFALATVNGVISASRVSGVIMVLAAGIFTERLGVERVIAIILVTTGVLTILLGVVSGRMLLAVVFFQPVVIAAYFPAAVVAMADLTAAELRNVVVSLMIPAVNLIASGIFPSVMGTLMERSQAGAGFVVTGALMVSSIVLFPLLWGKSTRIST